VHRIVHGSAAEWSPDGKRIAFAGSGGFYVARADGSHVVRAAESAYTDLAGDVAWSPDGRQIAYVACTVPRGSWGCVHSSAFDVYVSSATGGPRRRITKKTGFPQCIRWSRRGWLAWATGNGTTGVVRPDGSAPAFYLGAYCAAWSPDGRRFVVATATGVGIVNADGSGRRYALLSRHATFADPTWSPDGKQIAVVVTSLAKADAHGELYTLKANGTDFRRVPLPRR
jgi:Tol biopolymer transport system component